MNAQRPAYWRYGGQAVIEGVMMRSPRYFAVACRKPDGDMIVHAEPIEKTILGKLQFLNRPLLRGIFMLIDSLALGIKSLHFSSQVQIQHDPEIKPMSKPVQDIAIGASALGGFAIGMFLFFVLPTLLTDWLAREGWGTIARNMVDGGLRIAIFLLYVGLIGLMPDIRRVFQYHGAEHKAINALEEEGVVSVDAARRQTRLHPRCGTSFVLLVLILSIFVFAFLGRPPAYIRIPDALGAVACDCGRHLRDYSAGGDVQKRFSGAGAAGAGAVDAVPNHARADRRPDRGRCRRPAKSARTGRGYTHAGGTRR
jgi:Predicted metal-dependent enzyme